MLRRDLLTFTFLSLVLGTGFARASAIDTKGDPYEFIVTLSNMVLDNIKSDKELNSGKEDKVRELVSKKIMPYVDFTTVTRIVVGPKWRQASDEQKTQLKTEFENLLLRVYSGALLTIKDHVCELKPVRNRQVSDEMVIRTVLKSNTSPAIGLDYRIYKNKEGDWKIVDVNVEGIWMVENYRSQFASVLSNGGIDSLIKAMKEKKTKN